MSFSLSFSSFASFFFIFLFPFLFPFPFSFLLSNAWLVRQMSSEKNKMESLIYPTRHHPLLVLSKSISLLPFSFSIDGQPSRRQVHSSSCAQRVLASKPEQVSAGVAMCAQGQAAPPSLIFPAIQLSSPVKFVIVGEPSFNFSHPQLRCAIRIHSPLPLSFPCHAASGDERGAGQHLETSSRSPAGAEVVAIRPQVLQREWWPQGWWIE
jgi:hypothetical protein